MIDGLPLYRALHFLYRCCNIIQGMKPPIEEAHGKSGYRSKLLWKMKYLEKISCGGQYEIQGKAMITSVLVKP